MILLQLWSKIALRMRWPPSFISPQITSFFLSLCSHKEHKPLKRCSSFRIESLLSQTSENSFLGGWGEFSNSWLTTAFGLIALQYCCTWYVGMCPSNGHGLASIISGFILFFCYLLVWVFRIAFLGLKC